MRRFRFALLAVAGSLALAVAAPHPASASQDEFGRLVRPDRSFGTVNGGDVTGEGWRSSLATPADQLGPRCLRLGRDGVALLALPGGDAAPECRATGRTAIYVLGLTSECDAPLAERASRAEQRRCALDGLTSDEPIVFTVDGRRIADLDDDRYVACSPQRRVRIAPDNVVGAPAGPSTVTACGYVAWLVDLPPGRHTLRTTTKNHKWSAIITVGNGLPS